MKYTKNIFAVSFIAIMSVAVAHAEIVSDSMLNTRLGTQGNLAEVASTGSYNSLSDRPTIPTVNNAMLTIQKNGTTVDTFTANSSTNKTVNITVPTKVSELSNDSGFAIANDLDDALAAKENVSNKVNSGTAYENLTAAQKNQAYPTVGFLDSRVSEINTDIGDLDSAVTQLRADIDSNTGGLPSKQPMLTTGETGNIKGDGIVSVTKTDGVITVSGSVPVATDTVLGGVKIGSNITVADDGTISTHAPVTPGNGTVTITQNGTEKGKFTLNQGGNATITLTDTQVTVDNALDANSTNPVQNKVINTALGGKVATTQGGANAKKVMATNSTGAVVPATILGGGSVTVNVADNGNITVSGTDTNTVTTATTTGSGNVVSSVTASNGALTVTKGVTAATPTDVTNAINALDVAASTAEGNVVTNVSQTDGKIAVTRGTITSANNPTVTIKQGGVPKGTFTLNQTAPATIELTDNNTTYTASGSNGVSASVSGSAISVSGTAATRDTVGVAKLGIIPSGATGNGTATIWVE